MYEIIKIINCILRNQVFSNPLEYMRNNELGALFIFSLLEVAVGKIAFTMCGILYKKRSNKILGSIGYMFFYCINIQFLIKLCQYFNHIYLVLLIYIIFVMILFVVLFKIKKKKFNI